MVRRFAASASSEEGIQVESKTASIAQLMDSALMEEDSVMRSDNKAANIPEESASKPANLSDESVNNATSASEGSASLNAIQTPDDVTKFEAAVKVEIPFLRFVTGRGGKTRSKIEKDTDTKLFIPHPREIRAGTCLVVKGPSQEAVDAAVSQVQNVLQEAETRPGFPYSHFISIPLPSLVEQVRKFQESAVATIEEMSNYVSWFPETSEKLSAETVGVSKREPKVSANYNVDCDLEALFSEDEIDFTGDQTDDDSEVVTKSVGRSICVRPETFHLTVLMLKLWNEKRVSAATEVLQGVKSGVLEALEGRPIKVHLKGLECMKGNPAKAHVLCMRVQEANQENRLIQACQIIIDAFIEAGLVQEEDKKQELKLHATLMNTANRRNGKKVAPFDARQILIKHRFEDWGEQTLSEVHLSQRFVFGETGYYQCCGAIQFPTAVS